MDDAQAAGLQRPTLAPVGSRGRPQVPSLAVLLLVVIVIALPVLLPRGPGNSVPADAAMLLFLAVAVAVLWARRVRVEVPLGGSYLLIVLGGTLAVTRSVAPVEAGAVVLQDLYIYLWFLAAVNLILLDGSDRLPRLVLATWNLTATAIALLVIAVGVTFPTIPYVFGWPMATEYGRVMAMFRDPNMAGNYLVVSLFVLWASPIPTHRRWKLLATLAFVLAIYHTHSITALVTLVAGCVVGVIVASVVRRGAAVAAILVLVGIATVIVAFVPRDYFSGPQDTTELISNSDVFAGSLGRSNTSLSLRVLRWRDALMTFGDDIILGIGASTSDMALRERGFPTSGEIHNDFIAGFIERGLLGGAGVIALFVVMTRRALQVGTDTALRRSGWRPSALVGAMVAVILAGISLETLHFRHVWMLFALITALGLRERRRGNYLDGADRAGHIPPRPTMPERLLA
ncbi:MAG TPA: O-antigen ligase family protein [Actinomycetota bacterium]|nr:O-antigen ligase family protein [Actinomycetota bacterium]